MSSTEDILGFAETKVYTKTGLYLSELQKMILLAALQEGRKTYEQIADECGYSAKYLKQDVAPKLWQSLSEVMGEKVSKSNVRGVFEREMRKLNHSSPPLGNLLLESPSPASKSKTIEATQTKARASESLKMPPNVDYSEANILLVDDQPQNLNLLSDLLEQQGYEVRQAISGAIALQAVSLAHPDLILLDINMPEMDGYTVCQHLKGNPATSTIPVIFVSALDEAWDKVKAFSVGAVDYISKPFKVVEVLARVENQLKIQLLQKQLRVQNAQLQQALQELERLAAIDHQTQIANRWRFDDYLRQQWQQGSLNQDSITLILVQIDDFKNYNQSYGEQAGDKSLFQIAQVIRETIQRPQDLVCRYSGARFGIILPNVAQSQSQELAQSILAKVEALKIPQTQDFIHPYLTVSIAIKTVFCSQDHSSDLLISECINGIQKAESEGGNRLILS